MQAGVLEILAVLAKWHNNVWTDQVFVCSTHLLSRMHAFDEKIGLHSASDRGAERIGDRGRESVGIPHVTGGLTVFEAQPMWNDN
jgi:hypothetical protein